MVGAASASLFILVLALSPVAAQEPAALLPRPQFAACDASARPLLPEKWRATYLMAPFNRAQLVISDIVYDASLSAMRVRLHGVQRGAVDLLVVGTNTFQLGSEGTAIRQCRNLGDTGWRPLPRDWLTRQSQCTGSASIGETPVEWWKTPIKPEPASYWVWYRTADRSPFRLVFSSASDRLPPLSRYALSYQADFQALSQTALSEAVAACQGAKPVAGANGARALRALIDAMPQSQQRSDAEIERLMPALDAQCPDVPFPQWPERLALTGLMTPFDSDENPYLTEVLYDWTVRGQRSRVFGNSESDFAAQDFLLLDPRGYTVTHQRSNRLICKAVLPGTIRPDWASRGSCTCAAVIRGTTPLSPHGTTRILSCPLASPRVAWAWYALAGRPTVFMVTSLPGDQGKRLFAVLDYKDWIPNHPLPHSVFDAPLQCTSDRTLVRTAPPPSLRCSTCHLGPPAPGR